MHIRWHAAALPLTAVLTLAFAPLVPAGANEPEAPAPELHTDLLVTPAVVDPTLRPIAEGFAEWVRQRATRGGATVIPGRNLRRILASETRRRRDEGLENGTQPPDPSRPFTGAELVEHATRLGARQALLIDLRKRNHRVEVDFRLYDVAAKKLNGGGLAVGTPRNIVYESEEALAFIDERLALATGKPDLAGLRTIGMDSLAATTRSLRWMDDARYARAWQELDGLDSPLVVRLRSQIDALVARSTTSPITRARLLSVKGDSEAAWISIEDLAPEAYMDPTGSVRTLIAAGETQLERGVLDQSRAYFVKALEQTPDDPDANLGMARLLTVEGNRDQARPLFEKVAELTPHDPRPLELAAEIEKDDPELQAELYLEAAKRHSRQLNRVPAAANFDRAIQLSPMVEPRAQRLRGDLEAEIGEYAIALEKYERAVEVGREGPALLMAIGRTQAAAERMDASKATYEKLLKDIDPSHAGAMVELGAIRLDEGDPEGAISLLERAHSIEPTDSDSMTGLARALTVRGAEGDRERALKLLRVSDEIVPLTSSQLQAMAQLERDGGNLEAAAAILQKALAKRELDVQVQQDIVDVMKAQGDPAGASRFASRFSASGLGDFEVSEEDYDEHLAQGVLKDGFEQMSELVASFAVVSPGVKNVVLVGVVEPYSDEQRVWDWIRLRTTDMEAVRLELSNTIAAEYALMESVPIGEFFQADVDRLFHFDDPSSRGVQVITDLNITNGSDAVFVARLKRVDGNLRAPIGSCREDPHFEMELRRLAGEVDAEVQVLANATCLRGGVDGPFGRWNAKSAGFYVLLLVLLLRPFVRGWGRVTVRFALPTDATALFAVRLARRPGKVRDRSDKSAQMSSSSFRKQLGNLTRSERRLSGDKMDFKWVPAKRGLYYLTVRGPLVDLKTHELIGEFLEERVLRIKRGEHQNVDFDLCAREAAITVTVKRGEQLIKQARVAVRGKPGSERYCSEGQGLIYVGKGQHMIVVGAEDCVAELPVFIEEIQPVALEFNLNGPEVLFENCRAAVDPYLECDFAGAAELLLGAGHELIAHQIRALRAGGPAVLPAPAPVAEQTAAAANPGATAAYPDDVDVGADSTDFQATAEELAEMAPLFEQEGDFAAAAEAYRNSGDLQGAARCYESAYDWNNAIECYQDLNDTEKVLGLMERAGEIYEAASLAEESGQADRAIHNYQQIDSRHPRYIETCRSLAQLFEQKGEVDLASEKLGEAMQLTGTADVPLEMLDQYAKLLERAARHDEALKIYETIRLKDLNFSDVNTRIETLKKVLTSPPTMLTTDDTTADARTVLRADKQPAQESRYEILDELGRGGMGVVYKAMDKHLQRVVALKVLSEHLRQHQSALDLFLREARSAAALNHRNIVIVYDAGQEGSMDFISMEHLQGSGLDAILKHRGALNSKTVASIGIQVAAGLDYAQQNKIIHRDIKPSNLFITKEKVVKIMDFGLAKMVEEVRRASTVIGGTPNYMAPEQAIGNPTDHRADLYALGGTLFHLLTGTVPFEDGDVTYHHAHSAPPDPREREVSIPEPLAELIVKLMQKDPADRPQSAREVAVVLQEVSKG